MSEKTIWEEPEVERAVDALKAAIKASLLQAGAELQNFLIGIDAGGIGQVCNFYEGCNCPGCATRLLTETGKIFNAKAQIVAVVSDTDRKPVVH